MTKKTYEPPRIYPEFDHQNMVVSRQSNVVKLQCPGNWVFAMRPAAAVSMASLLELGMPGKHDVDGIQLKIVSHAKQLVVRFAAMPSQTRMPRDQALTFARKLRMAQS